MYNQTVQIPMEPDTTSAKKRRQVIAYQIAAVIVFVVLGFSLYSNTFNSPFNFDDLPHIPNNPHIRLTKLNLKNIIAAGFKSPSSYRPVANISFALNYYFHQYNVVGYHLVNIVIHMLTGVFLYLFVKNTLRSPSLRQKYSRYGWIPFFAAIVWFVHPVQTQSVTYIVQRMNSMAGMFYVLSLLLYVKGRLAGLEQKKSWPWFTGIILSGILAFLCKQMTATLPFFILLYEWYFFQQLDSRWLKRRFPYVIAVFIVFGFLGFCYLGTSPLKKIMLGYVRRDFTLTERLLTQFRIVIHYISLLIFPHPSRLNLDYDFTISHSLIDPPTTLLYIATVFGLIGLAVWLAKKERLLSFCILWFFGNLAMESSVLGLELVFEHRLYLPSMLVSLAVIVLAWRFIRQNYARVLICCIITALFCLWTYERNSVWRDSVTLWQDCVNKSPNKARPHNNLALALQYQGRIQEAIRYYLKAQELGYDPAAVHNNMGAALAAQGNLDEAIAHYRQALELKPNHAQAYNNLGVALQLQNKLDEAVSHYQKALQFENDPASVHNNLGVVFQSQGKFDQAITHFRQALKLKPDYAKAHNNLGKTFESQERLDEAIEHYRQALRFRPNDTNVCYNIGVALASQGKFDEALSYYHKALAIKPDQALVLNDIAWILATHPETKMRDVNQAIGLAQRAANLTNHQNPTILDTLAATYAAGGQFDKAVETAEKAIGLTASTDQKDLASEIENRLQLYRANRPYVQK